MGVESLPAEGLLAILVAGFSMGIAGSLHCIGMCGPLVAAVFHAHPSALGLKFVYNGGRIAIYVLLGLVAGALGYLLNISSLQQFLSVFLGIVLVIIGLFGFKKFYVPAVDKAMGKVTRQLKLWFGKWVKQRGFISTLMLGFVNGLLPCGLTYMALAYSLTLPNSASGSLFMLSFGIGTLPAMIGIPIVMGVIDAKYAPVIRRFNTLILIGIGLLLIWRGYMQFQGGMHSIH